MRPLGRALAATIALAAVAAPPAASAGYHLTKVNEVFPGTPAAPDRAFIELKMIAPGQNLFLGHEVVIYDAAGAIAASVAMGSNAPSARTSAPSSSATSTSPIGTTPPTSAP